MREDVPAPKWLFRFLKFICPEYLYEEIEGDLIQRFEHDVKLIGAGKARQRLIWSTIRFFRPGVILRNKLSFHLDKFDMILSYFKIASRHLMGGKSFTVVNVLGLSVSITAFLLILQYISFELSFDNIHEGQDHIYRIAYEHYENGEVRNNSAMNFIGIQSLIKENFPEVKACTGFGRTSANAGFLLGYKDKTYYMSEPLYQTDSNFFKVFRALLIKGDPGSVLNDPHNLVISEKVARQMFGDTNPVGQRIQNKSPSFADVSDFVITGVLRDVPENSHAHFSYVTLIHKDEVAISNYWNLPKLYSYLTIASQTDPAQITERLNKLLIKLEKGNPKMKGSRVFLQPISTIHLQSKLHDELEPNGDGVLIYIVLLIGIIILILAWINYINIETARFISRAKEVGVRRVIGSSKSDLALQFMVEYFCITILAAIIATILFKIILPHFVYLTGVPIDTFQFSTPKIWLIGAGLFFIGTIVAGICPVFFLLKINPVATLKGKFNATKRGVFIRKSLIVVQFAASMVLVAFLLVINEQLEFMRLTNRKIDLESVISVRNPSVYANADDSINYSEFNAFKSKLFENHLIQNVTSSSVVPGTEIDEDMVNRLKRNLSDPNDPTRFKILFVDYDFIPFYGLKLNAGRNYSIEMGDEENWNSIILNEKAMRHLGFNSAREAINQEVHLHLWGNNFEKYRIVGIVDDYHQEAIKKEVDPVVLSLNHSRFQQVFYSVKLNAGVNAQDGLNCIEKGWRDVFPNKPFEYYFQDDYYDRQFKSEIHFERIFTLFSGVAVCIACLGILGMTLFEGNARLKEISIRKVLGASLAGLVSLLSSNYVRILFLSTLVSVPLIYFVASEWLSAYPVRIEVVPLFFLAPLGLILMMVVVTSGFQTMKTALTNPINHLRNE